ncbi:MAG: hypothetical protein IJ298_03525 [Ruminococcus sp.]|nr:hypothetical protein [Ruminococcus sp.]
MRFAKRLERLYWLSVVSLTIMSATVLVMPFANSASIENNFFTAVVGLLFWLSGIAGYTSIIMANKERKWFITNQLGGDISMGCRSGITTFFANIPAMIADVAMMTSFLLFVVINFTEYKDLYLSYVLLFLFLLSLNMHCLFNGRIYKSIQIRNKRRVNSHE